MGAPTIEITPTRWAPGGEAMGSVRGKPVVIWSGIPGEKALIRQVHRGNHQDQATWVRADHHHPHRVEPRCERYHLCGGCPLMHLDVEGQREARRQMVIDALQGEAQNSIRVLPIVPSPTGEDDFRHIIKLGIGFSDHGHLRVGAWGRRTRTVVPIPHCNVAAPVLRAVMATISQLVRAFELRPYEIERDTGILRAFVLRASRTTGEVLVTIVAGNRHRALEELAERLMSEVRDVVGVALHYNDVPGNAIFHADESGRVLTTSLGGRTWIEENVDGITFRIGPGDFFQTHPAMAEILYKDTIARLELQRDEPVLDLYCGVGALTLLAARHTGWALGVEEGEGAVEAARDTARRHEIKAEFQAARVEAHLDLLRARLSDARPVVIVDPARRGLEDGVIDGILALRPRRLAYISCNPRALARDLRRFRAAGMEAGPVHLYDMFPNTSHVEAMVVLRAPDADGLVRRAPRRTIAGGRG